MTYKLVTCTTIADPRRIDETKLEDFPVLHTMIGAERAAAVTAVMSEQANRETLATLKALLLLLPLRRCIPLTHDAVCYGIPHNRCGENRVSR